MEIKQKPSAYVPFTDEEHVVKIKQGHGPSTSSGSEVRKDQAETR